MPYAPDRKELDLSDWEKIGRPELLHATLNGMFEFYALHHSLPELNNEEHAKELLTLVHK